VESKSNKRFVTVKLFLDFEIEHSEEFAAVAFVVPYSDGAVHLTAGHNQRPLLAYIHACDWVIVEALIEVLKDDLFFRKFIQQVRHLGNQLVYVQSGDIIISEGNNYDVFLQTDLDIGDFGSSLGCRGPFTG
jgi:hypothetical protein